MKEKTIKRNNEIPAEIIEKNSLYVADDIENWDEPSVYDYGAINFLNPQNKADCFFNELDFLCKKYNISIAHEDSHGGFIIEKYKEFNIKWIKEAHLRF